MSYTKEQIDKLPKWAQGEIKHLQNTIKSLEIKLSEINGESETNTYISEGLSKRPLHKDAHIEFKIGKNNLNTVSVYVRKDGTIDINTDSRLGQDVAILPRAANAFYLTFVDR